MTVSGCPARSIRTKTVIMNAALANDGAATRRRVASSTKKKKVQVSPSGQRMKKASPVENIHAADATRALDSRQPSSRANRNAPSAARKNVIAPVKVKLLATGSRQARRVNGE